MMNDDRFNRIETALAHQDRQIQDLSEMIAVQWKAIERLTHRLDMAQSKLSSLETSADSEKNALSVAELAALEKPPHY